jgi:hypothetical protein
MIVGMGTNSMPKMNEKYFQKQEVLKRRNSF